MTKILGLVTVFLCTAFAWQTHRPVIVPEPWGCPDAPHMGGGDIYSPEPVKQGKDTLLYFSGWVEQCRINDAIYMARIHRGQVLSIQAVIKPKEVGFLALTDPTIVTLTDPITNRDYLLMYMTGVAPGDENQIPGNKIYVSYSWADDGINWSVPTLLLDGYWNPGAAVHPETGRVFLWATKTTFADGQWHLTLFDLGPTGTYEYSRTLTQPADINRTNVSALWVNGQWELLAGRWDGELNTGVTSRWKSTDGISWEMVTERFIVPPENYQAVTPAWDLQGGVFYARYKTGWPPDSSIWQMR